MKSETVKCPECKYVFSPDNLTYQETDRLDISTWTSDQLTVSELQKILTKLPKNLPLLYPDGRGLYYQPESSRASYDNVLLTPTSRDGTTAGELADSIPSWYNNSSYQLFGYKGGTYFIQPEAPVWSGEDYGDSNCKPVIGVDKTSGKLLIADKYQ